MNQEHFKKIESYIDYYYFHNGISPTNIEISKGTNMSTATVSRYISKMCEQGILESKGHRNIKTKKMDSFLHKYIEIPVWDELPKDNTLLFENKSIKSIAISKNIVAGKKICIVLNSMETWSLFDIDKGDYLVIEQADGLKEGGVIAVIEEGAIRIVSGCDAAKKDILGIVVKVIKNKL